MTKVLHLIPDEKVTPFVQEVYESAFPGQNKFRVVGPKTKEAFRFTLPASNVSLARPSYFFSREMQADLKTATLLVVHFMNPWFARAIWKAPSHTRVVWSGWGMDYQMIVPEFRDKRFLPKTQMILNTAGELREKNTRNRQKKTLKTILTSILFRNWVQKMQARVDYVFVLPCEYRVLKSALPKLTAKLCELNYYSVEKTFRGGPEQMKGPDILLGNSNDPMNNHIDAIEALAGLDLGDRRVIVPLSYGDNEQYKNLVLTEGARLLGRRFIPIKAFLPIEEYYQCIRSCGTVIMNHRCQQAIGNVAYAIYKGACIIIRNENPVGQYFKSQGCSIRQVTSSNEWTTLLKQELSPTEIQNNRAAIEGHWNTKEIINRIRMLAAN